MAFFNQAKSGGAVDGSGKRGTTMLRIPNAKTSTGTNTATASQTRRARLKAPQ
jgi:hypothetical protein